LTDAKEAKEIVPFLLTETRRAGTVPGYRPAGGLQRRRVLHRHHAARTGPRDSSADTDVSAIKRWAKLMMMIEAVVSLGNGALVIARAINILT
jgi:hypothetical protein